MATTTSLESLLAAHRTTLETLYTSLSLSPAPLIAAKLDAVHLVLSDTIAKQRSEAELAVSAAESRVAASWQKVADWRAALGETGGKERGVGPLEVLAEEVEVVLGGMRSRMEERGRAIVVLQKRLKVLADVLGMDFLTVELEKFEQGWEALDLRLERMSALEREVLRCDAETARRRAIINANAQEIFALRAELGIHQDSLSPASATHPSDSANAPLSDVFDEAILCHLGVGEGRERKELLPTTENLQRIEAKRRWLEEEKDHRNALIQSTYDKLHPLWAMLGVSDDDMDDFVNRWMGSTADVVNAYQTELSRMLTLKRSNLSSFIIRERETLTALWDALYLSPQQRLAAFPPFAIAVEPTRVWNAVHGAEEELVSENVSEELLVAHERERERVEGEVERTRPVLERLGHYFKLLEQMRDLEASAADPGRLTGKSSRGDPGRLLREEKLRKTIVRDKPKLEMELRQIIPQWEAEHQRPFLINGQRFLDDLDRKMEEEAAEKESKKRPKASASASTTRTAPLRAQKTGGTSSSTAAPLKRQMTGPGQGAAKRQIPMTTGGSSHHPPRPKSVLGDIGNAHSHSTSTSAPKLHPQSTGGRAVAASVGPAAGGGGMKIPAGWGCSGASSSSYSPNPLTAPADALHGGSMAFTAATGGLGASVGAGSQFRPRSSTQSSVSGVSSAVSGAGWSTRTASTAATSIDGGC